MASRQSKKSGAKLGLQLQETYLYRLRKNDVVVAIRLSVCFLWWLFKSRAAVCHLQKVYGDIVSPLDPKNSVYSTQYRYRLSVTVVFLWPTATVMGYNLLDSIFVHKICTRISLPFVECWTSWNRCLLAWNYVDLDTNCNVNLDISIPNAVSPFSLTDSQP